MSRPLFDPSKMAAKPRTPEAPATPKPANAPMRVRELAALVDGAIRRGVASPLRVVGEVSGLRERTHLYFDLKDGEAVVSCVLFANVVRKHRVVLRDGLEVVVTGSLEFYAKAGKLSFIGTNAQPVGAGALDLAFKQLCEELRGLGWFDDVRKRPLPAFPRRVAVITSRSSAALQDVLDTMRRRCPSVEVAFVDARVQGETAAAELRAKLVSLSRQHHMLGIDAVIITRGGGSAEDLWAFNDRALAEAILKCPVPVVAAIGHETDTTIAELVADVRAATPTQAAMRLTPDGAQLLEQVDIAKGRMRGALLRRTADARRAVEALSRRRPIASPQSITADARAAMERTADRLHDRTRARMHHAALRLERLSARLDAHKPAAELARRAQRLDHAADRLRRSMSGRLEGELRKLDGHERQLRAVGPQAVLARGYSYTTLADGRLVRSASGVSAGDELVTTLADGRVRSTVDGKAAAEKKAPAKPKPTARKPATRDEPPQLGLFGDSKG
ncbi:MAG: exodeoxyribonuclease VII large subunit [Phycisphaerales bacterium]|jgi:exodeoxyribonuclease VII large subunit